MILVSKIFVGSVALATFAGSVAFPDVGEAARRVAASIHRAAGVAVQATPSQQPEVAAVDAMQLPPASTPCPGRCEVWELFAQIR